MTFFITLIDVRFRDMKSGTGIRFQSSGVEGYGIDQG